MLGTPEVGLYIAVIVGLLFLVQFMLTIIGSDFDISSDFDMSDIFSFKGIMHFALGFSLIWALIGINTLIGIASAVICGAVFVVCLGWLYRFIYKRLGNEIQAETLNDLVGRPGKIYFMLDNERAVIKTIINGCEREIDAKFEIAFDDTNTMFWPKADDPVIITKVKNEVLYMKLV